MPLEHGLIGRKGERSVQKHAMGESIFERPMFGNLIIARRCILPIGSYIEGKGDQTYVFSPIVDGDIWSMAGIYDTTHARVGAAGSFATITLPANPAIAHIHDRMPLLIPREAEERWLSPEVRDPRQIAALITPYPTELMRWELKRRRGGQPTPREAAEPPTQQTAIW